jgi:hypothetical protein
MTTRWPSAAPASVFSASAGRSAIGYDFETAAGWTTAASGASAGLWERGSPVSTPNWPYDPRHDADGVGGGGAGACYVTGNSNNSDLDNGSVLLTSPSINAASLVQPGERAGISYAYFLHHVSPAAGALIKVEASSNGGTNWTQIALHNSTDGANWRYHTITQDELAGLGLAITANFMLRFTATDADPQSIIEAGVDDVRIWGDCGSATCPGDVDDNGSVDVDDLIAVILNWGACGPPGPACPSDIAPPGGNGQVDVDDLIAVILGWGVCP